MNAEHTIPTSKRVLMGAGAVLFFVFWVFVHPDPGNPLVGKALAVAVLMAFYWLTEAVPMAVTALIPVVAFPFLGVLTGREVAPLYINNIIFLFIGGFLLAISMERWNLHRRIALRILLAVGRNPTWLLFGFMAASWVLSGWVSNTATTLMMVPIVMALAAKFEEKGGPHATALTVCLLLGIAYASSIGGMATLIGTAPNLSFARIFSQTFPEAPEVTFLGWMAFAVPVSAVMMLVTFGYLRVVVLKHSPLALETDVVREEYDGLGSMTYEEKCVFWTFCAFIVLIVTRGDVHIGDSVVQGWASRIGVGEYVTDGTVSVAVALLLFFIPARREGGAVLSVDALPRLPWDIIILLGGGFALAKAFQVSGLSGYLGGQLSALKGVHPFILLLAVCGLITFLTELTSNTATTQVVLPIIASMAVALGINPLFLMVPVTISASCAFMLPVATPPNAIVFGTHRLRVSQMARVGLALNLTGIVTISTLMYLVGRAVFGIDLEKPPAWM
jgi:sodium-dependent dicarboxylate transporter 2/3/5